MLQAELLHKATTFLQGRGFPSPTAALILGSGLGELGNQVREPVMIPYSEIPGFPPPTVAGHKGALIGGSLEGKNVLLMQGRFHCYEGHSFQEVTFPVHLMKSLGVKTLIVTNASGGLNPEFSPGDLMLITDHINLMGGNPLVGLKNSGGDIFPDLSRAYDQSLRSLAKDVAWETGVPLVEGVYVALLGPSYETPAELRFLRGIGADAVGMSTVPEVITAVYLKIRVLGISCVTNVHNLKSEEPGIDKGVNHHEVLDVAARIQPVFQRLIKGIIARVQ